MQAVILATSGMNSPHSRIASGVQACCCSACVAARAGVKAAAPTRPKTAALAKSQNDETFLSPAFFIGKPVPCLCLGSEHFLERPAPGFPRENATVRNDRAVFVSSQCETAPWLSRPQLEVSDWGVFLSENR